MEKFKQRRIVIINQAVNHITIGYCNAFAERFENVALITGSIHTQGEDLNPEISVSWINNWVERPQSRKMRSYVWACIRIYWLLIFRHRHYEVFFVSVPPMAYLLNLVVSNRFSMLIWDVYPDVFKIFGISEKNILYRFWSWLNQKSFEKAYRIFTIGEKMAQSLSKYIEKEKIIIIPIWPILKRRQKVDSNKNPFIEQHNLKGKFIVQYSGNIGLTHNVELVIELAERLQSYEGILFQIIGRGPRMPILQHMVQERGLPNCHFLPFQSDEMFPYSLSAANIGVAILNESTSTASVPAKCYNLMIYEIPALYLAAEDSQLNHYAQEYNHAMCFEHKQLEMAANFILKASTDKEYYQKLAKNAGNASSYFRRNNADLLVGKYSERKHLTLTS